MISAEFFFLPVYIKAASVSMTIFYFVNFPLKQISINDKKEPFILEMRGKNLEVHVCENNSLCCRYRNSRRAPRG